MPNVLEVDEEEVSQELEATARLLLGRYFDGLHTTLWGRCFDLVDAQGRKDAAEWFVKEMKQAGLL